MYQGIGGLTAAIGLRQQGHEVTVSLHAHALAHSAPEQAETENLLVDT